jgi:hypothetical protein
MKKIKTDNEVSSSHSPGLIKASRREVLFLKIALYEFRPSIKF